ncbi:MULTISPECIES: response regulator [Flavobacterium]|uniref:Response regulator n=1 Tax=Flavobacterium panici TaxID=2654843 RepID=A0A9N8J3Z4_9FLAO|nr:MULTISPECIES: response regulator [Flavobacterium]UUF16558.1 response regulator [Flavobacterium panici]CAC9975116.1 response regulator [Flavobacterium panici]
MELKPSFLLIEDNLIDQLVTRKLLTKVLDIDQVFVANNGLEGLQWIIKNKKICHSLIILLDIQMPIMNGFEFLDIFETLNEEIKNEILIFVMSSTLDQEEIKRIKDNIYVKDFLTKPFPIEELKKQLTSYFLF